MKKVPLYNLPQVPAAAKKGLCVFIVEGEKDADRLNSLGYVATCNYDGAGGKWHPHSVGQMTLAGRDPVLRRQIVLGRAARQARLRARLNSMGQP